MNGDTRQRCADSLGLKLALAIAAVALLVGCGEPPDVLDAAVSFAGKVSDAAKSAAELDSSSVLAALIDAEDVPPENEPTGSTPQRGVRTYYQFIDDRGSVRFVATLAEVPERWRGRAGSGSIPVLDVGGEIVRGYDPVGIDRLLAKL